jgi:hypothetical protein
LLPIIAVLDAVAADSVAAAVGAVAVIASVATTVDLFLK